MEDDGGFIKRDWVGKMVSEVKSLHFKANGGAVSHHFTSILKCLVLKLTCNFFHIIFIPSSDFSVMNFS